MKVGRPKGSKKKVEKRLHEWTAHNVGVLCPSAATKEVSEKQHNQYVAWNKARAERIHREKKEARRIAMAQFIDSMTEDEKKALQKSQALKTHATLTPVDRAVRIKYVLDKFKDGWGGSDIVRQYMEDFDCGKTHADYWRKEAMKALAEYTLKDAEQLKNIQLMRLESILRSALEHNDYKASNAILETINKLLNLYKKEPDVVVQPVTQFSFGGDDNLRDQVISVIENYTGEEVPEVPSFPENQ